MNKTYMFLALFLAGSLLTPALAAVKDATEETAELNAEEQQTFAVSGTVKSEDGTTLPGVNVLEKGTANGTSTDANGKYTLNVSSADATVVVSFIGYATQEINVAGRSTLDVPLVLDVAQLSEVVVVGYGTQLKKDLTGAISTVKAEEIAKRPLVRIEQALQGTTAGVIVTGRNGQPGQGLAVKIRGANSITGSTEPLYVIDGAIGSGQDVNVNDIESIEVLKDAASAAIYGSRGSNGVVLITTKAGKSGKMQVNVDAWIQRAQMPKELDLMNSYDFARSVNNQFVSTGSAAPFSQTQLNNFQNDIAGTTTDWQRELHTEPIIQNYQVDIAGGTDAVKYRFSLGYLNQPGIILNQWYKRTQFRSNVDIKASEKLGVRFITVASVPQSHNTSYGGGLGDPFNQATEWDPTSPVRDSQGNFISNSPYASIQFNPIAQATNQKNDNTDVNIQENVTLTYKILDGLTFTSTNVLSIGSGYRQQVYGLYTSSYTTPTSANNGSAQVNTNRSWNFLTSNFLTYNKKFGDHAIEATALYESMINRNTSVQARAASLSTYSLGYYNLSLGTQTASSGYSEDALVSYMARVGYTYKDKYSVRASLRTDGSSHLTEKYSSFPSVSLGWTLSNEEFLRGVSAISSLKLWASYGQTGNQAVPAFATIPTISTGQQYWFNGTTPTVATPLGTVVSQSLNWEVKTSYDFGVDAEFFGGRLIFRPEVYFSEVNDLLYNYPSPDYMGGGSYQRNIGSISNNGLALTLGGTPVAAGKLKWTSNFTLSANRNKVLDLGGLNNVGSGGDFGRSVLRVGEPLGEFLGYQFLGTWKSSEKGTPIVKDDAGNVIDKGTGAGAYAMQPGDAKYLDVNNDGAYTSADYVPIGNGTPTFGFGFINDIDYGNFTLSFMFQGIQGSQKFAMTQAVLWGGIGDMKNATTAEAVPENLWSPENENDVPAWSKSGKNQILSSRYVYDASYIKLKNISLSYHVPTSVLSKIRLRSLEVYVSSQNLFTITNYPGYDPEVENGGNAVEQGREFGVIPNPKMFTGGIKLGF